MNRAFFFIMLGAALWGTIGWYVKNLYAYGFTPMEVVTLRVWSAAILIIVFLLLTSPNKLRLNAFSDLKYFIGTGVFSIVFFNFCLFTAIELSTIPAATALLYTGPAFVTVLSFLLFQEPLTKPKITALLITLIGCALVVGLIPINLDTFHMGSILFGLGSGFGYALYSIFSKFALKKYTSLSITAYTFIAAAVSLLPFFPYQKKLPLLADPAVLFYAVGLGFLPTAFAYIIYTYGLNKTEASKASILTTIEPVVATLVGVFIFQEAFSGVQFLGMACIIGAVIIIQISSRKKINEANPQ
ncbi:Threonine/homoserine efflux transporter RhtA [Lentibacillus persicus]|uniref:Threonine/homoserine efflux transporter RhtA n=1 Tax=Lentibacillus persicus TaxID=640948 RepID=A0A1I1VLY7_9BACI|nr:EamA family transporter [Lentibacillus persicus]SFD84026.1 Threonine/homoserine efflux transporter RhtA [Lentibacillus persicus]